MFIIKEVIRKRIWIYLRHNNGCSFSYSLNNRDLIVYLVYEFLN